jgi:hypothetical protein
MSLIQLTIDRGIKEGWFAFAIVEEKYRYSTIIKTKNGSFTYDDRHITFKLEFLK